MAGRKGWRRPRNLVLMALVAAALSVGVLAYRMAAAEPGRAVDYGRAYVELVESYQPAVGEGGEEEEDGYAALRAAIAILREVEGAIAAEIREELRAGGMSVDDAGAPPLGGGYSWPGMYAAFQDSAAPEALRRWTLEAMRRHAERGLHDRLAEAAARARAVRPLDPDDPSPLATVLIPDLVQARSLARLGAARLDAAASEGDGPALVAAFEQTLAVGRICAQQGTIVERLVGVAIQSLVVRWTQGWIEASSGLDPAVGRALLAALERQTATIPPFELQIRGERLAALEAVQLAHTDDGRGDGVLLLTEAANVEGTMAAMAGAAVERPPLLQRRIVNAAGVLFPGKARTVEKADAFFDGMIGISRLPAAVRPADGFDPDRFIDELPMGYIVLRQLLPGLGRAQASVDQGASEIARLRLTLAVEVFRAERGRLPSSVEELVPSLLPETPTDPSTGTPLRYRPLRPGEPAATDRGYIIEDGDTEEGGRPAPGAGDRGERG